MNDELTKLNVDDKSLVDIFKWVSPVLRVLFNSQSSNGNVDFGEIVNALKASGINSIDINSRSLYEIIDAAVLDKKISQTVECDAFLLKLRQEILNGIDKEGLC